MAVRLVTEVMDWAPPLTHREHKVLIILAENAKLPSRETWDSVEDPKILHRARLTQREMYAVIAALVTKRCLEKPVWGGRNHRAKYRIAELTGQRPRGAADRQFALYADHDQHAEKPHPENHDQHADLLQTEKPRSACGKTAPRLPVGTGGPVAQVEGATTAGAKTPDAAKQGRAAEGGTPRPSATPPQSLRDHDGPEEPLPPVEPNLTNGVPLQSPATARIAREAAEALREWERLHPEAAQ